MDPLYNFTDNQDGYNPITGMAMDGWGCLYGTTSNGGPKKLGTIYELTPPSKPNTPWTFTTLYTFTGKADGGSPQAGLIMDGLGNLYGTTTGNGAAGDGTVFELSPPSGSNATWTLNTLHVFTYGPDGAYPVSSLILDSLGNLYGTTEDGGPKGGGTAFEMIAPTVSNPSWTFALLHAFTYGPDGGYSVASLTIDPLGNLYGAAEDGGKGFGTVFELIAPTASNPSWGFSTLYSFTGKRDGASPEAGLILDSLGNLYGTTPYNGIHNNGSVYRLAPPPSAGHAWTFTALYSFLGKKDGGNPQCNLIMDSLGNLFGTTPYAGPYQDGTVFELTPPSPGYPTWLFTTLYAFTGKADGSAPQAGVIMDNQNNLYGTTPFGGQSGYGTVFRFIAPAGIISKIAPASINVPPSTTVLIYAYGPSFIKGAVINFNGTRLKTTLISTTALRACIPATLLTQAGTAQISVTQTEQTGNSLPLNLNPVPQLVVTTDKLTRDPNTNNILVPVTVSNTGLADSKNVSITLSTLSGNKTLTTLPVALGGIVMNGSASTTLSFDASIGIKGQSGTFKVTIKSGQGAQAFTMKVTIP